MQRYQRERGNEKVARSATEMLLSENGEDVRSAAGVPWKNYEVPPDVRGARAKAATSPLVVLQRHCFKGTATAK